MDTKCWKMTNNQTNTHHHIFVEAADLLKKGLTVAFPTETVYGLGADATNERAVSKIFQAKGRPEDNPLIVHVASKAQLRQLVSHLPPYVERLMDAFSPGPITFVLPSNGTCAKNVTAGLSTIAVRIPNHPIAQQLLAVCDVPIAAPSANISGKPSPTIAAHVWEDLSGKIAGIIDGGPTGVGMESTVVNCTQESGPIILRPGGITKEQIEDVISSVMMEPSLTTNEQHLPISPGMKYKHYSPEVPLWLVDGAVEFIQSIIDHENENSFRIGVLASTDTAKLLEANQVISLGKDLNDIAANLYDGLRQFKKNEIDIIVCESFPEIGIGQAIMNRLRKAASSERRE